LEKFVDPEITKLIELTTIVKVTDNQSCKDIYPENDGYYVSRFQKDQGRQVDLSSLVNNWERKWQSFGDKWNKERQNYRFLFNSFKLFWLSFEQLNFNKVACSNQTFGDRLKMRRFNDLTGVALYGIYHHGKKCIDLLKDLKLLEQGSSGYQFCNRYAETRNKFIEHNYNPSNFKYQIDPQSWSLVSTDSLLEIHIHEENKERKFDVHVDYYEDYYQLEIIIVDIIREF